MRKHKQRLRRASAVDERATRGAATLELVILFPALLLVVFTVVQAALFFYARSIALAAAQEGVRAGRALHAERQGGVQRAQEFLAVTSDATLHDVTISSTGTSTTQVRIQVSGRALSVLPGAPGLPVSQEAQGPRERFTSEQEP